MKYSPYARLDDNDTFKNGDEIRFDTPFSHISQYCDVEMDYKRSEWRLVSDYWIGKKFGTFRKGVRKFGKIDCRRKVK